MRVMAGIPAECLNPGVPKSSTRDLQFAALAAVRVGLPQSTMRIKAD